MKRKSPREDSFFSSRLAALALLCFLLVAAASLYALAQFVRERELAGLEATLANDVAASIAPAASARDYRIKSALFLAEVPPVQGMVRAIMAGGKDPEDQTPLASWRKRLETIFAAYIKTNPEIFQARLIGVADKGRELVRVDRRRGAIVVVPEAELQSKGDRDYFTKTIQLAAGEVYVSDINLNVERGKVEVPHRPTTRTATPIYDAAGQVFGILVLNVDASERLAEIAASAPKGGVMYATNTDGDFLVHPDASRIFGFDLGKRHRWQDEFTELPGQAAASAMRDYRGSAGLVHVVTKSLPRQPDQPDRLVRLSAVVPDSVIQQQVLHALIRATAMLAGLGLLIALFLYLYWVGARRQVKLQQQRLRIAAIVDHSNDAVIGLDPDGAIESWNRAAERLFGYTAAQAQGKALRALIVPAALEFQEIDAQKRIRGGGMVPAFDTQRRHRDGRLIDVSVTMSPVRSDDGGVIGSAIIARDISEQKAAQAQILQLNATLEQQVQERTAQLAANSALQRAILVNAGHSIIATDTEGLITLFNPAAEQALGYSAAEMVGKLTPASFHLPEEVVARAAVLSAELDQPITPGFEVFVVKSRSQPADENDWTYVRKDGSRFPVRLKVSALRNTEDQIFGYLGIAIDQTERQQREKVLAEARAAAESASGAKSQFLANMSHEIRTPMNAVLGMLQLLRRSPLSFVQADYAVKAESAARTLLSLLNDILDFSKIEAGKFSLDVQPFMVDVLLREIGVILSANIGGKDVEVLFDIDPALPTHLAGDRLRLQQVLLNLAGNAVKFTERGEIIVGVKLAGQHDGLLDIAFSVSDTGIGITEEQVQRIFTGFEQAEASTGRRYGGTGLGLSISRSLVRLMGGDVQVESIWGHGSTFWFTIPMAPAPSDAASQRSAERLRTDLHGLQVLVVDDNPSARGIIAGFATSFGWRADTAANGAEALKLLAAQHAAHTAYDVAFIDWRMPEMDGWAVSEHIRQGHPETKTPLIIMATAHGREALAERIDQGQAVLDGFLVKPITASMLFDAVADARAGQGRLWVQDAPVQGGAQRLLGLRLLVVEDNLTNQQVAHDLLGSEGAVVTVAGNGRAGIEAVRAAEIAFDAVLMDIQMPDMDGYAATAAIRNELGRTRLPIIAMTANAMPADRDACLAAGMNEHVGKPFHIDELVELLLRFTGRKAKTDLEKALPPGNLLAPAAPFAFAQALSRLGNNQALFARHARSFTASFGDLPDKLREQLQAGELTAAMAELHTLKGVAGTLGAMALARSAAALEAACKLPAEANNLPALLDTLQAAMTEAQRALENEAARFQPAAVPALATSAATAPANALARLDELGHLLAENNMRAMTVHVELRAVLGPMQAQLWAALDDAIGHLDFARAGALCQKIREGLAA